MKVCPDCGRITTYNSYFNAYLCSECGWYKDENQNDRKLKDKLNIKRSNNHVKQNTVLLQSR